MEIKSFSQFILEHKNHFEKRKYFILDKNFKIVRKEPSFILEMAYIYCENEKREKKELKEQKKEKILENIKSEFEKTFLEKEKKIKRQSKIEVKKLEDSFTRSLFNRESNHALKLGNEMFYKNKKKFFEILYNFSFISADENKFIKTFFVEKMIEKIIFENGEKYSNIRFFMEEILKNVLNYFTKSQFCFLDFEDEKNIKYFLENEISILYKKIYVENFDKIIEKYEIRNLKKINFEKNYSFEELSESKKILYNFI